ncbi:glycoside hydrolase family 28 protein [Flavobacterium sp. CSZ]|uniref:glycoside hydrolase family 28 protein n=1 Tax=Flavobacterium sp. CSZ TaxID=2783791 RepID=UPI00188A3166|nr:glycoside hydrolase family 28 protein [Flavobacterium sp. CSZ]MBF4485744.1 glycoside hydrolase family 28 protein [Flavobacterium sp. CSZ]
MKYIFLKKIFYLFFFLCSLSAWAKNYDIKALGADNLGNKSCTAVIHKVIALASKEGGGTLYFPAGNYLTGPITLKSNITIYLEAGATLKFSSNFKDYLPFQKVRYEGVFMKTFAPLLNAQNADNVTIKGEGTIDGNGFAWWEEAKRINKELKSKGELAQPTELQNLWARQNSRLQVEPYYQNTLKTQFFRPPFIQFVECNKINIEGIRIINSPFWTINPVGCNDVRIHGVTILNPDKEPHGPNTDGINPSSCSNVRISDCFISVGDDCITIKSGRDFNGREYGKACENITITNCVMLAGHGGVVIGSEMSGGVKNVVITNCVFDGTDAGIRMKASRGRGGIVENIMVSNIVMRNISRNAFTFDLFYDRSSKVEPVSERTPIFRNIAISNVTGRSINKVGVIYGIEEMPIDELTFTNINMEAKEGFTGNLASNVTFSNVDIVTEKGPAFEFTNCEKLLFNDVKSKKPIADQPILKLDNCKTILVNNCFQKVPASVFVETVNSDVIQGNNFLSLVKIPFIKKDK